MATIYRESLNWTCSCGTRPPTTARSSGVGLDHPESDLRHPEHGEGQSGTRQEGRPRAAAAGPAARLGPARSVLRSGSSPTRGSWPAIPARPADGGRRVVPRQRVLQPPCLLRAARSVDAGRVEAGPAKKPASAAPPDRYALLADADRWSGLGHPGYTRRPSTRRWRGVIPAMPRARRAGRRLGVREGRGDGCAASLPAGAGRARVLATTIAGSLPNQPGLPLRNAWAPWRFRPALLEGNGTRWCCASRPGMGGDRRGDGREQTRRPSSGSPSDSRASIRRAGPASASEATWRRRVPTVVGPSPAASVHAAEAAFARPARPGGSSGRCRAR